MITSLVFELGRTDLRQIKLACSLISEGAESADEKLAYEGKWSNV